MGVDKEGNLYKGIVAFMVVGLKQPIPFVVQAFPEVTFNGQRLAEKISDNIDNLIEIGLCVRGIVTDNHSPNINKCSALIKISNSESNDYIKDSQNSRKTYLFYDTVHLMKSIRNNLLNKKKFVFSEFVYNDNLHINLHIVQQAIFAGLIYVTFLARTRN